MPNWHNEGALEKEDFLRVRPASIQGRVLTCCGPCMDGRPLGESLEKREREGERETEGERERERFLVKIQF